MKNILIILGLLLFSQSAFAIEKIYLQQPTNYSYLRPTYNPYSSNMYYSPYRYRNTSHNNAKRIQRINRLKNLNRIKNNFVSWNLNRNNFNNGRLTGYSMPINQNALNLINPNDFNYTSPNLTTDIFTTPSGNRGYYRNGQWSDLGGGLQTKTGVRIIYD